MTFKNIRLLLPSLLFFLFICFIIYLADTGERNWFTSIPKMIPYGDKVGHFVLYGIMAFLLNFSLKARGFRLNHFYIPLGSVIVLLFAIGEEFTQLAFASRTFDFIDMLFDLLGIIFFSVVWRLSIKKSCLVDKISHHKH